MPAKTLVSLFKRPKKIEDIVKHSENVKQGGEVQTGSSARERTQGAGKEILSSAVALAVNTYLQSE